MIKVSFVDLLSDEEKAGYSLFPVKENAYSYHQFLGCLGCPCLYALGIAEGMTDARGSETS